MIDSRLFDILLVDSDQGKSATVVTPPPSTPLHLRCAGPQMQLSALARREYAVRRTCTQDPHSCITYCTPSFRGGTTPGPQARPNTCAPLPSAPLTVVAHVTGPDRRLLGLYETMFGSIGTFHRHESVLIESVPTVLSSSWPASVLASDFRVGRSEPCVPAPSTAPPPFALTAAQPSPPTPLHVCRVQPKHPCIACRTHPARAVLVPRPEHARTHAPPCCPHVAGAHVTGPDRRLPGCEETFFGAISTCATVSLQRCHA
jgi:hypothetical protein